MEHILHHAIALVHVERTAVAGNNARSILAAMLQHQQPIIKQLVGWLFADNADDSAHGR